MQVQFEFTQEDLVDVTRRSVERSKVWRSTKWKGLFTTAAIVWAVVFLFSYSRPVLGVIAGFIGAVLAALLFPVLHKREIEKRLRERSREMFGNAKFLLCEVELKPEGVWVRVSNHQLLHEWPGIQEIKETPDAIYFFTYDGSSLAVRNRAFANSEERSKFVAMARARLKATHDASTSI